MKYRQGITHCVPHDKKMPCAECAKRLIEQSHGEERQLEGLQR